MLFRSEETPEIAYAEAPEAPEAPEVPQDGDHEEMSADNVTEAGAGKHKKKLFGVVPAPPTPKEVVHDVKSKIDKLPKPHLPGLPGKKKAAAPEAEAE